MKSITRDVMESETPTSAMDFNTKEVQQFVIKYFKMESQETQRSEAINYFSKLLIDKNINESNFKSTSLYLYIQRNIGDIHYRNKSKEYEKLISMVKCKQDVHDISKYEKALRKHKQNLFSNFKL